MRPNCTHTHSLVVRKRKRSTVRGSKLEKKWELLKKKIAPRTKKKSSFSSSSRYGENQARRTAADAASTRPRSRAESRVTADQNVSLFVSPFPSPAKDRVTLQTMKHRPCHHRTLQDLSKARHLLTLTQKPTRRFNGRRTFRRMSDERLNFVRPISPGPLHRTRHTWPKTQLNSHKVKACSRPNVRKRPESFQKVSVFK